MNYTTLCQALLPIAKEAGKAILDVYHNSADLGIVSKADDSPLTLADQRSNAVITKGLEQLAQQFPILSEENTGIAYEQRKDYDYYWLVDPLDGTKEFINRNGEFTVNIALIHQQRAVLGVVYTPVLDELYWAARGIGAWKQKGTAAAEQISVRSYSPKDENIDILCSRSHLNDQTKAFVGQFSNPNFVAKGSSLKFLLIAEGKADIYPRLAPTMEWDTAAAQIILEEAGGEVLQYASKDPVLYNKENLLNPFFIARGKEQ